MFKNKLLKKVPENRLNFFFRIETLLHFSVPDNQISLRFGVPNNQILLHFDVPDNHFFLSFAVPDNCS